jgi:hypothetical protein
MSTGRATPEPFGSCASPIWDRMDRDFERLFGEQASRSRPAADAAAGPPARIWVVGSAGAQPVPLEQFFQHWR